MSRGTLAAILAVLAFGGVTLARFGGVNFGFSVPGWQEVSQYVVVYLTVWWTVLFVTLPLGVRSQKEAGEVVPGSEPGAPVAPLLWRKVWLTTVLSGFVTVGLLLAYRAAF